MMMMASPDMGTPNGHRRRLAETRSSSWRAHSFSYEGVWQKKMTSASWQWPGVGPELPPVPPRRFEPRMQAMSEARRAVPGTCASKKRNAAAQAPAAESVTGAGSSEAEPEVSEDYSLSTCQHTGCAFLCTGLTPNHCCKKCAATPGMHGPKCKRQLLMCSTDGCNYAVTGLTALHCCRRCGSGTSNDAGDGAKDAHGPYCWRLPVAGGASESEGGAGDVAVSAPSASDAAPPSKEDLQRAEANRAAIAANAEQIKALYESLELDLNKSM